MREQDQVGHALGNAPGHYKGQFRRKRTPSKLQVGDRIGQEKEKAAVFMTQEAGDKLKGRTGEGEMGIKLFKLASSRAKGWGSAARRAAVQDEEVCICLVSCVSCV
jgi:hypothetical protein